MQQKPSAIWWSGWLLCFAAMLLVPGRVSVLHCHLSGSMHPEDWCSAGERSRMKFGLILGVGGLVLVGVSRLVKRPS